MAVYRRGFQKYDGERTPALDRFLVLPRFAWSRLFAQKLVLGCLLVSCFWPLLCAMFIYLANNLQLLAGFSEGMKRFMQINGSFFYVFMNTQATFTVFLAALAGPGLIAPDLSNNALGLYLARPISRLEYAASKLVVLAGLLSLISLVPALLLFLMQVSQAGWDWFAANWTIFTSMLLGFGFWILLVSLVAMASSAYVKWRVVAGAVTCGFFFLLAGAGAMIDNIFRSSIGNLISPFQYSQLLWSEWLGVAVEDAPSEFACLFALTLTLLFLMGVIWKKLRAVEVIR